MLATYEHARVDASFLSVQHCGLAAMASGIPMIDVPTAQDMAYVELCMLESTTQF